MIYQDVAILIKIYEPKQSLGSVSTFSYDVHTEEWNLNAYYFMFELI